jgi:hypothetical protein
VRVQLSDRDGNIFVILAPVARAMHAAGIDTAEIKAYQAEMMASGSYDAALQVCLRWVDCE